MLWIFFRMFTGEPVNIKTLLKQIGGLQTANSQKKPIFYPTALLVSAKNLSFVV